MVLFHFKQCLRSVLAVLALVALAASTARGDSSPSGGPRVNPSEGQTMTSMTGKVRVAYLHHSTGANVWNGGVPEFVKSWNTEHGTDYRITEVNYPATDGGRPKLLRSLGARYPWANYPYDYWNLWVAHSGKSRDRGELNLDDLVKDHDVIVFKHCYPVSAIGADAGAPSVSSSAKTLSNYKLQYEAIKARLHQFPAKRFILWTSPALPEQTTTPDVAERSRQFVEWVKRSWDEPGDNIYLWDFHALETEGGPYLKPDYAMSSTDPHPNATFSRLAAPLIGRRIVDVIEGRGDSASLAGR